MKRTLMIVAAAAAVAAGIYTINAGEKPATQQSTPVALPADLKGLSVATFAGGCFWCVEAAFQEVPGVRAAISGFSGGEIANPTYKQVAYGRTKHTEAVQVYYDPTVITYEGLLQVLWRSADPTDADGQFSDRGKQYRPAIFYHDDEQKRIALRAREELARSKRYKDPVTIEIVAYKAFYPAENRHQDYYLKNPLRYRFYTIGSGRAGFQEETWGDDIEIDFEQYRPPQSAPHDDAMKHSPAM